LARDDEEAVEKDEAPPAAVDASAKPAPNDEKRTKKRTKRRTKKRTKPARGAGGIASRVWLALLTIGLIELWAFGSRGHIQVCVAHEGTHDFALLGEERTDANTRRYPSCEKRTNLGIVSGYDASLEDAAIHACRRATILRPKEVTIACVLKDAGWQHQVTTSWCPPWHDHYYKRLFWFAFDS
jgi:hypothetical protein